LFGVDIVVWLERFSLLVAIETGAIDFYCDDGEGQYKALTGMGAAK